MTFLTLDTNGIILAVIMGIALLILGLSIGYFFLISMLVFLFLSAIVTWTGMRYKKRMGLGQSPRGVRNVLANGMPPIIMAVVFRIASAYGNGFWMLIAIIGFLGSIAAITADKFNSEIGVLNGMPRMIFSMRKVKKGTSGGITALGIFAGIVAAFIVALLIIPISPKIPSLTGNNLDLMSAVVGITIAGIAGGFVDSALGYYEEKGIGNKFTSNFSCGIVAGIIAILLFIVL